MAKNREVSIEFKCKVAPQRLFRGQLSDAKFESLMEEIAEVTNGSNKGERYLSQHWIC